MEGSFRGVPEELSANGEANLARLICAMTGHWLPARFQTFAAPAQPATRESLWIADYPPRLSYPPHMTEREATALTREAD